MAEVTGVTDLIGAPVAIGDRIAAAFRIGNVAHQRVGTILDFGERGNKLTIKVQWEHTSGWGSSTDIDTVGAIEAGLKRFVKISSSTVTANP